MDWKRTVTTKEDGDLVLLQTLTSCGWWHAVFNFDDKQRFSSVWRTMSKSPSGWLVKHFRTNDKERSFSTEEKARLFTERIAMTLENDGSINM